MFSPGAFTRRESTLAPDGFCVVAGTNKCLAQSDKSRMEDEATKKRIGIVRRTIEQSIGCGVGQHELKAGSPMTFATLSTGAQAKFSPQLLTSRGRPTKFTLERLQQIRNLVERGESRDFAELLDVTVGSLQVTCSRLGISLKRPKVDNGVRLLRPLNSISRKKTITMHNPTDHNGSALSRRLKKNLIKAHSRDRRSQPQPRSRSKTGKRLRPAPQSVAIKFQYKGTERTTELPLNLNMIGRLAWEAEFRNMSIAELIAELIMGMVKKDLFPQVLGKP